MCVRVCVCVFWTLVYLFAPVTCLACSRQQHTLLPFATQPSALLLQIVLPLLPHSNSPSPPTRLITQQHPPELLFALFVNLTGLPPELPGGPPKFGPFTPDLLSFKSYFPC